MKILLLEDNQRLSSLIQQTLQDEGYRVDIYDDGKKALENIDNGYDCFVLDIHVPGLDGLSILKQIRLFDSQTPAIIISANIELESIKEAYSKGCDEYLKKPFYMYELQTKLEKLCIKKEKTLLLQGGYSYNILEEKLLDEHSCEIKLAKKEILLLDLFAKHLQQIVSYEMIEQYVWEGELTSYENIRALIKRLRKKLPPDTITSQGGIGYKLVCAQS